MNAKKPGEMIVDVYTKAVGQYSKIGLWPSESLLTGKYFQSGTCILDMGCGAGRTSIELARTGYHVIAFDIVPDMVDAAVKQTLSQKQSVKYLQMDASLLAFKKESFDGVLFSFNGYDNIFNRSSRIRLLHEVARVLKPGGHFILTARSGIAFGKRWLSWIFMAYREVVLKPLGLANRFLEMGNMVRHGNVIYYASPFTICKAMRSAGFTVEEFNSDANLRTGRKPNFLTNFSNDISLFFVGKKARC